MQCAQCGHERTEGASFVIHYSSSGRIVTKPIADQEPKSDEVFLCLACQVAARHRTFRVAALISGAVIVLMPAVVALVLFPSFLPTWSVLGIFLLQVPVLGLLVTAAVLVGLGALARLIIDAFGTCIMTLLTWQKPYTVSGENADFHETADGETFAIQVRQAELRKHGYDIFWTRAALPKAARVTWIPRVAAGVVSTIGLFALGLFVLVFIACGSVLVESFH